VHLCAGRWVMSGYILLGLAAVFCAIVWFGHIRDLHDAELRDTDPDFCRYGATLRETWVWWWRG
jgi:hypothetical protein